MSPEFLITSLIVVIAPGTGVIYTLTTAISRGSSASVIAAFGCTLGIIPHIAAAIFGLAALLHTSAVAFQLFKYAGLAYLLYLAWVTLKDQSAIDLKASGKDHGFDPMRDGFKTMTRGTLINILNPKLSVFFLAFLPQFVSPLSPTITMDMLGLSLVFMAMTFVVFVAYGLGAASVRHYFLNRPSAMAWMRRAFAGAFVGLGLKLAFTED